MSRWSYKIACVWGIPIRIHATIVLLIPFLQWDLGRLNTIILVIGAFTCITLHELGHSFVALRKGCKVREILILPIGGVAQIESAPRRPLDEAIMAIAGPAVSLALFGILTLAGPALPLEKLAFIIGHDIVRMNVAQLLGWINLVIVVFNLIPAFPMDGGRVLRAALTPKMGRLGATIVAAGAGRIIAVIAISGALFTQLWSLVLIFTLIFIQARKELQFVIIQEQQQAFWTAFERSRNEMTAETQADVVIQPPAYGSAEEVRANIERLGIF